jgi:hypothetical protein
MAISEACQFEIKEEVDRMKDEGISLVDAFKKMVEFYAEAGVDVKEATVKTKYYRASEKVSNETPQATTQNNSESHENQVEPTHGGKREGSGRSPKYAPPPVTQSPFKQTNPDVKSQLQHVADEIKRGAVNDDDAKTIGDALADAIQSGKAAPRVATAAATAVKKFLQQGRVPEPKPVDNFYRLSRHALALQEGLQFWADGTMKPESEDEAICAKIVREASASIVTNYARLGIDVENIYATFYKGGSEDDGDHKKQIGPRSH